MEKNEKYTPTEGEEFLEDYFNAVGIKYDSQTRVPNLSNDNKWYRTADFYLPKYKVYVEFFGLWNNSGNDEYRVKKQVYRQNKIPCVYIYPENLGIIDYTFDKRIQIVLKEHNLMSELRKYYFFKFWKSLELRDRIGYLGIAFIILLYKLLNFKSAVEDILLLSLMLIIVVYQSWQIIEIYFDIFKRNKFSLVNL